MIRKSALTDYLSKHKQFTMVPNSLWTLKIDKISKLLYAYFAAQSENWSPGRRTICKDLSIGPRVFNKALEELENCSMVEVEKVMEGKKSGRNIYILNPPSLWMVPNGTIKDKVKDKVKEEPTDRRVTVEEELKEVLESEFKEKEGPKKRVIDLVLGGTALPKAMADVIELNRYGLAD